ncbi:MAG: oligosaccharide flippase family protein, partial [Pelobium sp.]
MYKRLKLKFSNTHLLSLSANVIVVILGILSYVLLCRILTLRERGVWLFFQSLFALADSIRSGFLSTGFIKFYAGVEKKRATEVAGSTWIISIAITLIFCMVSGASYFTTDFIEDEGISYFLKWLGVLAIVSLPHFMAICLVQAKEHFGKFLVLKLFRNFIFITCFVTFYFYNRHTAIEIIYSYLISFTISSLLTLILGWCDVKTVLSYNKKVIKELLDFGKYSMGTNLSATLFQTVEN